MGGLAEFFGGVVAYTLIIFIGYWQTKTTKVFKDLKDKQDSELGDLNERYDALEKRQSKTDAENVRLTATVKRLEELLTEKDANYAELKTISNSQAVQISEQAAEIEGFKQQVTELTARFDASEKEKADLATQLEQTNKTLLEEIQTRRIAEVKAEAYEKVVVAMTAFKELAEKAQPAPSGGESVVDTEAAKQAAVIPLPSDDEPPNKPAA